MSRELIQQFNSWRANDETKMDFVEHLKNHSPWVFSHHPHHACFREHVWKINGLYVCKGCLVTSAGFLAGLLAQTVTGWLSILPEELLGAIFAAMLLPTLVSGAFNWPRVAKHVCRFLLGALMASALLLLFVTDRWDVRICVAATFVVTQHVFARKRHRQNAEHLSRCT